MKHKHNFLYIIAAACIILFSAFTAKGQSVRGRVTDTGGETLPAALIQAQHAETGRTIGTTTALNGTFDMRVDPGTYKLNISFLGFLDKEMEITVRQDLNLGDIQLQPSTIGLEEVMVISSYARDRQTPVAISNIPGEVIIERLGSQEFPEILKTTPSVYATKEGGGYGDSRINLRGFDSNNIGVLINGVPVNDMENGRVYWSNWAGLSDVTSTMQVQRGLGASRLAISSVGGTINILTRSTDARRQGNVFYGIGNDGYDKKGMTLSTGLLDNGWAATFSGSRTTGDGYVDGLAFHGWSYFLNVSKQVNRAHSLSLTAFGAPQYHNQRYTRSRFQTYRDHRSGIKYNPDMGYKNGQLYTASYNFYHKPQISLNHFWSISPETTLSTSAYVSISSGGGRRTAGSNANWLRYNSADGKPYEDTKLTPNGYLDFDAVMAENALSETGSKAIISNAVNAHDWYGVLSTLNTDIDDFRITGGLDLRYYRGYHMQKVDDLLGGEYYLDVTASGVSRSLNRPANTLLKEGDIITYHDLGEVQWAGIFAQGEYVTDEYSAFFSTTLSNTGYRRTDYFIYEEGSPEQRSDWQHFLAYSFKGGANYNMTDNHNVFFNAGYFTRAPYFRFAFIGFTNEINAGVKHERVMSAELGYGYTSRYLSGNLTLYRTNWLDKAMTRTMGDVLANLTGLNALHQGIELELVSNPIPKLYVRGMASIGDWTWTDDVIADIYDENQQLLGTVNVFAGGLKVGNSAQTTAALGLDYEILPRVKLGVDFTHFDRLYAFFNVENRTDSNRRGVDAWRMPDYQLFDASLRYDFKLADFNASVFAKVNNIFDTEYIADGTDGSSLDFDTATGYYGFGRTWSMFLRIRF
jgi:iron complex outermembrane recepter protein